MKYIEEVDEQGERRTTKGVMQYANRKKASTEENCS